MKPGYHVLAALQALFVDWGLRPSASPSPTVGKHADGNKLSAHEPSFENLKLDRAAVAGLVDIGPREQGATIPGSSHAVR